MTVRYFREKNNKYTRNKKSMMNDIRKWKCLPFLARGAGGAKHHNFRRFVVYCKRPHLLNYISFSNIKNKTSYGWTFSKLMFNLRILFSSRLFWFVITQLGLSLDLDPHHLFTQSQLPQMDFPYEPTQGQRQHSLNLIV